MERSSGAAFRLGCRWVEETLEKSGGGSLAAHRVEASHGSRRVRFLSPINLFEAGLEFLSRRTACVPSMGNLKLAHCVSDPRRLPVSNVRSEMGHVIRLTEEYPSSMSE